MATSDRFGFAISAGIFTNLSTYTVCRCRISQFMTFVSKYMTHNVRLNDIRAMKALSALRGLRLSVLVAPTF